MATVQNQNQFSPTPILGQVSAVVNPSILTVRIDPSSVATKLQAGQAFKIVDVAANDIVVDQVANATETPFGVAIYNLKKNTYAAGDLIEIATAGSVVYMEASAAIARGAKVEVDPTGPTVKTLANLATDSMVGICLDKPAAGATLTRILIQPADPNLSAY